MADFNRKKLQVFVSSTFTDLGKERQAAVEAILAAGHIPAGMELFTAGDESQMEVIKQWIDESDIYLLILGGRYGSIEPKSGKSYIHLEYDYALLRKRPLFACVVSEKSIEARVKTEGTSVIEMKKQKELEAFRTEVLTKTSKFWEDSKDIKITIIETLSNLARREDLVGWVRPSTQSNLPALADEIARLSKENAQLRIQIASGGQKDLINGVSFEDLMALLDSKGLLSYLEASRRKLSGGQGLNEDNAQTRELEGLGLIVRYPGLGFYHLSESGQTFMNKLEVFRFKSKGVSPSP
jgi:hypothetical protein